MFIRAGFVLLTALFICSTSFAFEVAALKTETAEELLMFFEEEELVIATRHETPVRKAPAIATVITAKEIRDMGARNLMDVLKTVPGFGISISEQGSYMLEVRGIRSSLSEKVLMMIDGHSLNKNFVGSSFRHHFEDLPVENIKQIEIVRGPSSALYGANAFVSVINIITKDAENIDGLQLTAKSGSFGTEQYNLLGGKSLTKDLKVSGSLDYYRTDGAELRIEKDSTFGTPWAASPGDTELGLDKTDFFLKASYGDLLYRGHYMAKKKDFYIGFASALTDDNDFEIENYWHELSYGAPVTENLSLNIKVFFDHYEQKGTIELMPEGFLVGVIPGGFPDGLIGGPNLKNGTWGGEAMLDYDMFDNNHLIAGALYERMRQYDVKRISNYAPATLIVPVPTPLPGGVQDTSSTAGINWNRDAKREIWAFYIQDEWEITDDLNLTTGVRHDHYSEIGGTTNPRIGIVWAFLNNADLKLLYGRAFRAPDFGELYTENNIAATGSTDLDPETIQTYEAGLSFRPAHTLDIDLNYFHNEIKDLIVLDKSNMPYLFTNGGGAEVEGVELVLRGRYTADNYWNLSYTYQNPADSGTGDRLPDVPMHRASGSLNYGLTEYLNLHTDVLWTGERSRPEGDTRGPVATYTTVDLALTLKNFYRTLEIQGTVHNLFDEEYEDPDTSGASQLVPGDFPREGISGMITASYKY
ncbi:MAG: TonB-dependent receptor [Nitrospirae bacterium]|nr:TonB-dependent receptor [Nitrospirota bacterium]